MDGKRGIMMCKLKRRMEKGYYDVQIKRWMKKVALLCADYKGGCIRESIIRLK